MNRLKRLSVVLLILLLGSFAMAGVLSVTRGTPIEKVASEGESAPPAVSDPLFEQTFELYTGTHVAGGNTVEQLLNGNGTYPRLWADLRSATPTPSRSSRKTAREPEFGCCFCSPPSDRSS
jgi:hypothetical protein